MDRVILIQGPSDYVQELKNAWSGFNIIWSTYKGTEHLYTNDDIVIFNDIPSETGVQNIALQYLTTMEGIKKAKELGYNRVLKWRSDLIPNNAKELVKLFEDDALNFLAWHISGYFVDYFVEGDIDKVFNLWNIKTFHGPFSEYITTKNLLDNYTYKYNYIGKDLNKDNEIFWIKRNVLLSEYKNNTAFTTI